MIDRPVSTTSDDRVVVDNFETALELLKEDESSPKAIKFLKMNALMGDTQSMVLLGVVYMNGTPQQRRQSIALFRQAADMGNTSGMRNLAYCYAVGVNIPRDKEAAAILYKEAADNGNAAAACNYGVMLDFGNGVERNCDLAFRYYTMSAEGGCTRGMTNLGEYYDYGKGTERNLNAAEMWYTRSGSPRAHHRLAVMYLDSPEKRDREKGLAHLRVSADAGYSKAILRLADESEGQEAIDLYTQAARKGSTEAAEKLKELGAPVPECDLKRRRKS